MDILVHVDATEEGVARGKAASALASAQGGHARGLIVTATPLTPYGPGAGAVAAAARAALGQLVSQSMALRGRCQAELRLPAEILETSADRVIVDSASLMRSSDLVVCSAPRHDDASFLDDDVFEAALFVSGRPVLLVPSSAQPWTMGRNIAIAWKDCREAARAIHDAMPLLRNATNVTFISVKSADDADLQIGGAALNRMQEALQRRGVKVTEGKVVQEHGGVGETIIRESVGADLIVMGGYGHWRWSELLFGGVTRYMLGHMATPVFMSR